MSCCEKTIYEYCEPVPDCLDTLQIQTEHKDKSVIVTIIDRHGNSYEFETISDSNGLITIDLNENPFLILYNSHYLLTIKENTLCKDTLAFTIEGQNYTHIQFIVRNKTPKQSNYIIFCEEDSGYY